MTDMTLTGEGKLSVYLHGEPKERRAWADMVEQAVEGLRTREEGGKRRLGAFVTRSRMMHRESMAPTEAQMELYQWIRRRGFVPRAFTLAMNWIMLGGLMCRGLVEEARESGQDGIRAVQSGVVTGSRRRVMLAAAKRVRAPAPQTEERPPQERGRRPRR